MNSIFANTIFDRINYYAPSPEVSAILDTHSSELYRKLKTVDQKGGRRGVWTFSDLPGYFVKFGLSRIWGMELMQEVIDTHNLDLITLPDKRIYHLKGRPRHVNDTNYCVVVKKISSHGSQPISKELMAQLIILTRETKFISLKQDNYFHLKEGKICIIDTESNYDIPLEVKGYLRLLGYGHNPAKDLTEEALKLLFEEMKRLLLLESDRNKIRNVLIETEKLLQQHKPTRWNYIAYFKEYFADLRS
jgi:hypothetical protein